MLQFLFGNNKLKSALRNGAVIIDVRTVHEYDQGRIRQSVNIPFERIPASVERIRQMNKPIILVSSPDSRSGKAASFLKRNGITEVYNGGGWEKLFRLLTEVRG